MLHTHYVYDGKGHLNDDLKMIHGIGPALEKRLNQAGIVSYDQLSNMSNKEIAAIFSNIPGFSEKRIVEEDWKNQAQHLMEEKASVENYIAQNASPHSEVFSLDLLLDNQNRISRTHILHVQSLNESSWAGWNQSKLANFVLENAINKSSKFEGETPEKLPGHDGHETTKNKPEQAADLQISKIEIQARAGEGTNWLVHLNEPFAVGIMLDLSNSSIPPGTQLHYQTEIHAKNLANGTRKKIGELQGITESQNLIPIVIQCFPLAEGSYRLEGCAIILPDTMGQHAGLKMMAMTEGKIFKVN